MNFVFQWSFRFLYGNYQRRLEILETFMEFLENVQISDSFFIDFLVEIANFPIVNIIIIFDKVCDPFVPEQFIDPLAELAEQAAKMIRVAASLGKVVIVTNAQVGWGRAWVRILVGVFLLILEVSVVIYVHFSQLSLGVSSLIIGVYLRSTVG